ncbi:MAG: hypothetical protein KDK04_08960 [Candidatus Competibacteraceae bacterium]|nr:hypothetical protein [Candidatus Competibacteraceae bacterium]MCB1811830.1 hypothetical protein [Candidatus Competibacteraceae bacterium]
MMSESEQKAQLLRRRDELRQRLAAIQRDYRQGLDADSEEQAVQLENAEVQAGIAKVTVEELAKVEQQLQELDD